jgi:hypothetical protein
MMQVMTDMALLKCQNKKIEELCAKLQVKLWNALAPDLGMK